MGTIKIEFDASDFKEELNINIVIRRDGEVVKVETKDNSTFTAQPPKTDEDVSTVVKKTSSRKKSDSVSSSPTKPKRSGNMMGIEF